MENACTCVLGPWPWPRAFLSLASRGSVLGKAVLGLGFFLCPWPWPRALCPRLHLCKLHAMTSSEIFKRGTFCGAKTVAYAGFSKGGAGSSKKIENNEDQNKNFPARNKVCFLAHN